MKTYPSIDATIRGGQYYVFDKLDGSNIRAEWSKKQQFYKFGTRRRLLDPNEYPFGAAVPLIMELEQMVSDIAKKNRIDRMTLFFEFHGPNSFAGYHHDEDEKRVDLIDVSVYKHGILEPKEFLNVFGKLPHAELLYHGNVNDDLVRQVREGTLPGMTFEGIIAKAKNKRKPGLPQMFKVKNIAWYLALKDLCKDDEELFEKLK